MVHLTFDMKVAIIRLLIAAVLLGLVKIQLPVTPASKLDQAWLKEFFRLIILFFFIINFLLILHIVASNVLQIIYLVKRLFAGILVPLI